MTRSRRCLRFYAFCHQLKTGIVNQPRQVFHDDALAATFFQILDQRYIKLDDIDGHRGKRTKSRIAAAKVIQRNHDSGLAQLIQVGRCMGDVGDERSLGGFHNELISVQKFCKSEQLVSNVLGDDADAGDIDRHAGACGNDAGLDIVMNAIEYRHIKFGFQPVGVDHMENTARVNQLAAVSYPREGFTGWATMRAGQAR